MDNYQEILLHHYQLYPLMQIDDFVKLTYQMVYGPRHFSGHPTLKKIEQFLRIEILELGNFDNEDIIEDIGNDFVRVYLDKSFLLLGKLENIASMFYQSMNLEHEHPKVLETKFINSLSILKKLVEDRTIHLDNTYCSCWIKRYIEVGIRPISHSAIYRKTYNPHYRVIHQSMLKR